MTTATTPTTTDPVVGRRHELAVLLGSAWIMIGLFLDGWAHTNIPELESFFTPWHGVFYSGFALTALLVLARLRRRREALPADQRSWAAVVDPATRGTVAGLALFAVGGVGDGIWHTLLGVETSIDALLSPTHVVMFLGLLLVLSTPLRRPGGIGSLAPTWRGQGAAVTSLLLTVSLVAFFLTYLWGPGMPFLYDQSFAPGQEVAATTGMGAVLVSSLVLTWPLLWLLTRGRTAPGALVLVPTVVNALVLLAFWEHPLAILSPVVAGGVAEVVVRSRVAERLPGRGRLVVVAVAFPALTWATTFVLLAVEGSLQWPPELWGGAILFAGLSGLGLALLPTDPAAPTTETSAMAGAAAPLASRAADQALPIGTDSR